MGWSVFRAEKGPRVRLCRERCLHDGVCLTTVRRAEGVAKREELAVKRPGEPLFRRWSSSPPLPPFGQKKEPRKQEAFGVAGYILSGRAIPSKSIALRSVRARTAMSSRRNLSTASFSSLRMGVSW